MTSCSRFVLRLSLLSTCRKTDHRGCGGGQHGANHAKEVPDRALGDRRLLVWHLGPRSSVHGRAACFPLRKGLGVLPA
eukprot:scaffold4899_cov377-Prasinococcus_capsulatus_cf.AAC.3